MFYGIYKPIKSSRSFNCGFGSFWVWKKNPRYHTIVFELKRKSYNLYSAFEHDSKKDRYNQSAIWHEERCRPTPEAPASAVPPPPETGRPEHNIFIFIFWSRGFDSCSIFKCGKWEYLENKMRSVRGQTSLERSAFSLPPHMNEPILTVAAERTSQLLPNTRSLKRKCKPTYNRSRILQTNKRNFHHIFQKNKTFQPCSTCMDDHRFHSNGTI